MERDAAPEPFADLSEFELDPESIRLFPRAFCRRHGFVVLGRVDPAGQGPVTLGMLRPEDAGLVEQVAGRLNRPVDPVRLNRYEVDRVLCAGFDAASNVATAEESRLVNL